LFYITFTRELTIRSLESCILITLYLSYSNLMLSLKLFTSLVEVLLLQSLILSHLYDHFLKPFIFPAHFSQLFRLAFDEFDRVLKLFVASLLHLQAVFSSSFLDILHSCLIGELYLFSRGYISLHE
jgi:hypothetical protein